MKVEHLTLTKQLKLDNVILNVGKILDVFKQDITTYVVFHHTGWWRVSSEYFK